MLVQAGADNDMRTELTKYKKYLRMPRSFHKISIRKIFAINHETSTLSYERMVDKRLVVGCSVVGTTKRIMYCCWVKLIWVGSMWQKKNCGNG